MKDWFALKWLSFTALQQFEWANPKMFYFLILIPVLFFLRWVFGTQKKQALNLSVGNIESKSNFLIWFRYLIPAFFVLGMLLVIIALARPQLFDINKKKYAEGIDIALAIDISDSMLATDLSPNRLEAAKSIAVKFVNGRQNDRIALVAFAGESSTLSPLTTDYSVIKSYLANLESTQIRTSGTAIGMALASSINKLRDIGGKSKIVILISDGDNTAGTIDPDIALELAKTFGIKIYTIAIGSLNSSEKIDEKTLKKLAAGANGQFFRATDNNSLDHIFNQINMLEKNKYSDPSHKEVNDYYYVYLNWAIVFLLLAFLLKTTPLGNFLED